MANPLKALRRNLLSKPIFGWYRKSLPPMSDTEREAIEAGTVWFETELFDGKPDWDMLLSAPKPQLTEEEQAFLDGPTETLCGMVDEWEISTQTLDLSDEVWAYIKKQGFFGMIIPKEHGGLGFTALGHSAVVMKIATKSLTAAVTIMVPNSLGPGELLLHYGTEKQKKHYLPRLASGEDIPCFGLTSPQAGSDAAAMRDKGVVCKGTFEGKEVLGMRVSWSKRYITLGPVATLLGLAFKLYDPDHLLGDKEDLGITVALVPTDTPGVKIGRRHWPSRQAFQNGPNSGEDVFMPLDWIIGGPENAGKGWRMLVESLAAGRAISLPSLSTGAAKYTARTTGAYARVRKQFNLPVGFFEGVKLPLARIAGSAYLLDAAREITATAVDQGEKPSVLSAILKYHATERMRTCVNDAMDIHGGKAICDGPQNYMLPTYLAVPVGITVEGANILTRNLIIFGQGAIRAHPYLLKEMAAAQEPDPEKALDAFDDAVWGHAAFQAASLGRAFWHNLTGGRFAAAPDAGPATPYYRQISRASASFALVAETAMVMLGGRLKRLEGLSARLGDVLSGLYLASCALKRFEDQGRPASDWPLLQYAVEDELHNIQTALDEFLRNFPARVPAWILRRLVFPWGRPHDRPSDKLSGECADILMEASGTRDRLTKGIYLGGANEVGTGMLDDALKKVLKADPILRRLRKDHDIRDPKVAEARDLITGEEVQLIAAADQATDRVIQVDDFAQDALERE